MSFVSDTFDHVLYCVKSGLLIIVEFQSLGKLDGLFIIVESQSDGKLVGC